MIANNNNNKKKNNLNGIPQVWSTNKAALPSELSLSHLSSEDKLLNYITKAFKPIQQLLRNDSSTWWETALQLQLINSSIAFA